MDYVDKGMGVFNGDTGIIEEINDFAETMTVTFDEGRKVEYSYKLLMNSSMHMRLRYISHREVSIRQ